MTLAVLEMRNCCYVHQSCLSSVDTNSYYASQHMTYLWLSVAFRWQTKWPRYERESRTNFVLTKWNCGSHHSRRKLYLKENIQLWV